MIRKPLETARPPRIAHLLASFCTAIALSAGVFTPHLGYGHGTVDDEHDENLDEIPGGASGLLPDDATNPVLHGQVGPLLPMHTMSVHNTIMWKKDAKMPLMLMFHRHSAYTADEVANPDVIDFLIANPNPDGDSLAYKTATDPIGFGLGKVAFTSPLNQFNSSFRRSFNQFAYGGYNIIHDVSQSVPTRISRDQTRELTQLWDMNHADAFKFDFAAPKFSAALLTNNDANLNIEAFRNAGNSKGLFYDMYCPGSSTLADGRPVFMGGHDMNSQNGSYRIQIFDPEAETWAPRPASCMRQYFGTAASAKALRIAKLGAEFENDTYLEGYYRKLTNELIAGGLNEVEARAAMTSKYLPDCDPHVAIINGVPSVVQSPTYPGMLLKGEAGTVTHPGKLTSDMKYARWYPSQVTLPTNQIFIFSGWDRDETNYPQPAVINNTSTAMGPFLARPTEYPDVPANADLAGFMKGGGDTDFLNSRVKHVVPEIYDAATDTCFALENSPLFHNGWYPNGIVVQTGPGRDDWKIAVMDGEILGKVPSVEVNGVPVGAHKPATTVVDRNFNKTWILDVQGAFKDPARDTPPANVLTSQEPPAYWKFVAASSASHTAFTGNASIIELDKKGSVLSHKLTHFGGQELPDPLQTNGGPSLRSDKVEEIDFGSLSKKLRRGERPVMPQWKIVGKMYQPGRQNYATPLPDGTIVLLGGNGGTLPGIEAWSLHMQHYNPSKGGAFVYDKTKPFAGDATNSVKKLAKTLIPRDEHGIIQLFPDATVYLGGQNRNGLVRLGDPAAPLGDSDLGVPVGQLFRPPYLFDKNAFPIANRPAITKAPTTVDFGKPFKIDIASLKEIKGVSMIRTGAMSHSLNSDIRLVKVAFTHNGTTGLTVFPPKLAGTAIGGYYMLFLVDKAGVPSMGVKVALGRHIEKRIGKPLAKFVTN